MSAPFSIEAPALFAALTSPEPPVLIDVRRRDLVLDSGRILPAAWVMDHGDGPALAAGLDRTRPVVVACAHGHNRSQRVAAHLREAGFRASTLAGGYDAWIEAGLPLVNRAASGFGLTLMLLRG
jgi:rhodanese-related sulfurtransferase